MAAIRGHVDCRVVENPFSRWLAAIKKGKKIMVRKLFPSSNQYSVGTKKWNIGPNHLVRMTSYNEFYYRIDSISEGHSSKIEQNYRTSSEI